MLEESKRELLFFLRRKLVQLSGEYEENSRVLMHDAFASYYTGKTAGVVDAITEIDRILYCSKDFDRYINKQQKG